MSAHAESRSETLEQFSALADPTRHATDRRWLYYRLNRDALEALAGQLGWLLDDSEYDPTPLPCAADSVVEGA